MNSVNREEGGFNRLQYWALNPFQKVKNRSVGCAKGTVEIWAVKIGINRKPQRHEPNNSTLLLSRFAPWLEDVSPRSHAGCKYHISPVGVDHAVVGDIVDNSRLVFEFSRRFLWRFFTRQIVTWSSKQSDCQTNQASDPESFESDRVRLAGCIDEDVDIEAYIGLVKSTSFLF